MHHHDEGFFFSSIIHDSFIEHGSWKSRGWKGEWGMITISGDHQYKLKLGFWGSKWSIWWTHVCMSCTERPLAFTFSKQSPRESSTLFWLAPWCHVFVGTLHSVWGRFHSKIPLSCTKDVGDNKIETFSKVFCMSSCWPVLIHYCSSIFCYQVPSIWHAKTAAFCPFICASIYITHWRRNLINEFSSFPFDHIEEHHYLWVALFIHANHIRMLINICVELSW